MYSEAIRKYKSINVPFSDLYLRTILTNTDSNCFEVIKYNFKVSHHRHVSNNLHTKMFHINFLRTFLIYLHPKFRMLKSSVSLVIATNPKAKSKVNIKFNRNPFSTFEDEI